MASLDLVLGEVDPPAPAIATTSSIAERLHEAISHGDVQAASIALLEDSSRALDLQALCEGLIIAAHHGHASCAELMLDHGATANLPAHAADTSSPLHMGAQGGHAEVVQLLLGAGGRVDALSEEGATPTFVAALNGHAAVVSLLLDANAAPDLAYGPLRTTPLLVACQQSDAAVAAALLEGGADANLPDQKGATPLQTACEAGGLLERRNEGDPWGEVTRAWSLSWPAACLGLQLLARTLFLLFQVRPTHALTTARSL